MKSLPLVNYPTKIIWVDDDDLFLTSVQTRLGALYNITTFPNAAECATFLENYQCPV